MHSTNLYIRPAGVKPTPAVWLRHILLLGVTFCTATVAGTLFPFGKYRHFPDADPETLSELLRYIFTVPERYVVLYFRRDK